MMLVQSSCVWIPDDGSWQETTVFDEHHQPNQSNAVPVTDHKIENDSLSSRNFLSSSQLSTEVNMSENSTINFVYKRRKFQKKIQSSATPTLVYKRRRIQSKIQKCSNLRAVNESCSSSKSNIDPGSIFLKNQVDDVGECSSSGVPISETNSCISFLRQHGVFEGLVCHSKKPKGAKHNICCLRSCKVCDRSTTTLKMLICDLCENSFHMPCCNPPLKKVPVGDWFCNSCLRKKLKKMKEINSGKSSKDYLGPIASMLRVVGPYASNVRIGEDFQAEVPDWSGPLTDEINDYIEPMEISPLECGSYQDWDSSKLSRLSSIGNWLQCHAEVNGTVCGKWRRAPLFEVQTDDWECFCSVLWDPTHADCAVPQELDTDQVLKQLKYIEMLRPRLSMKRWKLGTNKGVNQQEDPRNRQKS